jgi:hypothetical protein
MSNTAAFRWKAVQQWGAVQQWKAAFHGIEPRRPVSKSAQLLGLLNENLQHSPDRKQHQGQEQNGVANTSPVSTSDTAKIIAQEASTQTLVPSNTHPRSSTWSNDVHDSLMSYVPYASTSTRSSDELFFSDPAQWFEAEVAKGTATISKAHRCLQRLCHDKEKSQEFNTITLRSVDPRAKHVIPKGTDFGFKVLRWLWSSGNIRSSEFMANLDFVSLLGCFLYVEGRQNILWQWFKTDHSVLKRVYGAKELAIQKWQTRLLLLLIKSMLYDQPSEAVRRFMEEWYSFPNVHFKKNVFGQAARPIINYVLNTSSGWPADPILFDTFVADLAQWNPAEIARPMLLLYHPTNPETQPALNYLKSVFSRSDDPQYSPKQREQITTLCLNTAKHLLAEGKQEDAQWILKSASEFQQRSLPRSVPAVTRKNDGKDAASVARGSDCYIDSLESLRIA